MRGRACAQQAPINIGPRRIASTKLARLFAADEPGFPAPTTSVRESSKYRWVTLDPGAASPRRQLVHCERLNRLPAKVTGVNALHHPSHYAMSAVSSQLAVRRRLTNGARAHEILEDHFYWSGDRERLSIAASNGSPFSRSVSTVSRPHS
jgi:hypothetical protein